MSLDKLTPESSGAIARQIINSAIQAVDNLFNSIDAFKQDTKTDLGLVRNDFDALKGDTRSSLDLIRNDLDAFKKASFTADQSIRDSLDALKKASSENNQSLKNEIQSFIDTVSDKLASLPEMLTALQAHILLAVLNGSLGTVRPGDFPEAFGRSSVGSGDSIAPIPHTEAVDSGFGKVLQIVGASVVSPRAAISFDPFAILVLRVAYARMVDVEDPNNNAIDVGIQWLNASGESVGQTRIHREMNLRVQDGQQSLFWRVPSEVGELPSISAPKGTASWRPYIKTYGADGATALAVLEVRDITFAGFYAPDLMMIEGAVRTIQGQIQNGLPFTDYGPRSYKVEDLPPPGSQGRRAFAENGRAPDLAGNLEPANAGTGVDVTDTGTKWVIVGTNQQVQS